MISSIVNYRRDQKCPIQFLRNGNWDTLSSDWKAPKRSNKKPQTQDFCDTEETQWERCLALNTDCHVKGWPRGQSYQSHGCWGCPVSRGSSPKEGPRSPTEFQGCLAFLWASTPPYPNQGQLGQLSKGMNTWPLWLPGYTCIEQSRGNLCRAYGARERLVMGRKRTKRAWNCQHETCSFLIFRGKKMG